MNAADLAVIRDASEHTAQALNLLAHGMRTRLLIDGDVVLSRSDADSFASTLERAASVVDRLSMMADR